MDRVVLKQRAKEQIRGNIGILIVILLVTGLLAAVANWTVVLSLVITPSLMLAMADIYLRLSDGISPQFADLFARFSDFWAALKVMLLSGVYTFLWSLLLVIPGIVKALAYSQVYFILAENPGLSAKEVLRRSEAMMIGHKAEYFMLNLSFIGWMILGPFTFGILYLWVIPYYEATMANYYRDLKNAGPVFP